MVKLVDDDDIEVRCVEVLEAGGMKALDGREHLFEPRWALAADPELAKRMVAEGMTEGRHRLREDLLAMRNE